MKITINDCLKLPAFEKARVLSCSGKTERQLRHISVLEASNPQEVEREYAEEKSLEHHMMVTGFYGIRDDEEMQCMVAESLANAGLPALALHGIGGIMSNVSEKLIDICERKGITLIALSSDASLGSSEVIEQISQKLYYGDVDRFDNSLITNTIYHLLNFEKYADFPAAVRAAAENNAFQLVLLSSDLNPVLTIETQQKTTVERAVMVAREKAIEKRTSVYTMINVDGVVTYWGSAAINGEEYYMFVADNEDSYSTDEIIKLADIIELSMGMWKYTPASDNRSEFVKALGRGNMATAYERKEDAGIDEKTILSVFAGKCDYPEEIPVIIDKYCAVSRLNSIHIIEGNEICGIILAGHSSCNVSVSAKLYEELKVVKGLRVFHVTGVDGVEGSCDAFKLINENMEAAQAVFPFKRVFSKYDLSLISNCNKIQAEGGFIKKIYLKLLEAFGADSGQKGKQLLETLETFVLDAGMNVAKTSEIMEIHANTVQYRLKKINEVLGAEITGNRVIPGLTVALALNRLEKARGNERRTK